VQRFTVTVTSPDDRSVVTLQVPRIVVAFNHPIDASLVNDTTVSLERTGAMPDASAMSSTDARAERLSASAAVVDGNPRAMLITPSAPLANGVYRVTLRGTGGAALAGVSAGVLGVDYSFTFTVDVSS
jgi:methionine-rich copper-binding protein CopC